MRLGKEKPGYKRGIEKVVAALILASDQFVPLAQGLVASKTFMFVRYAVMQELDNCNQDMAAFFLWVWTAANRE